MGLLSEFITEQDLAFDETKLTDPKKFKRGTLADIGLGTVSGVAKGVTSVSNAASRFVEGDEVADKRMQQVNEAFTPLNQGQAGQVASGITEVVSAGAVGAPLGPYGMATTVGLGTRAIEHTKLTQQLGVDQETADTVSNIYGATNAALAFLPVSNVFKKSLVADYAALVVAPTAVGQASIYTEGAYLDGKGYEKQAEQYKDMATDPTAILMNLGIGTIFFAAGRYMNAKGNADLPEAEVHKAEADLNATVEQAQADADVSSMPNVAETVDDLAQHQTNINQAIEQVMKGEKVNISEATGGQLKTLDDVKKYLQTNHNVVSSNKQNNSSNNTVNKIDIKAPVAPKKDQLVKDTYQLAQAAGFSPAQARALIGELGRENDFNISTMFGFHKDEANHKQNGGIFSWQGDRAKALQAHMTAKGLVNADGTFKRTNESLQAQFEFLRKEIEANPKWKQSFLDKKNISNNEARAALGGTGSVIGWARGQSKLKSGKAFDWQSHEARANNYSNMVDGEPIHTMSETIVNVEQAPIKPESSYEGTIDRLDLDNVPRIDNVFISPHDFRAFDHRNMDQEVVNDLANHLIEQTNTRQDEHTALIQRTVEKLTTNPSLVISSKRTGEDLTAAQWKDRLIQEQDNITMMTKAMSTLAKCALKQAA
ncbi:phage tail tip lysozyme [Acinetobacter venetianus]|uniref:phage tail tip lysozyme n=1 Tax=Acinetobacter venetianus TaxID=52133 RepID=UPI003F8F8D7A